MQRSGKPRARGTERRKKKTGVRFVTTHLHAHPNTQYITQQGNARTRASARATRTRTRTPPTCPVAAGERGQNPAEVRGGEAVLGHGARRAQEAVPLGCHRGEHRDARSCQLAERGKGAGAGTQAVQGFAVVAA